MNVPTRFRFPSVSSVSFFMSSVAKTGTTTSGRFGPFGFSDLWTMAALRALSSLSPRNYVDAGVLRSPSSAPTRPCRGPVLGA